MPSPEDIRIIRTAGAADAGVIAALINTAFRVESFFIDGDRVSTQGVRDLMDKGVFLLIEDTRGLAGCVYVEVGPERAYMGLLSTEPSRQRKGLGSRLVAAAEEHSRTAGCRFMDLRVVNLRTELPSLYRKLGYDETGVAPFPADVATKLPCHFITMSKSLV